MTKIKVTKKKLNLDTRIRKSRSPRKKFEDSYKVMTKIEVVKKKIEGSYDKNQDCLEKKF